jgi:hypothetical protein
MRRCNGRLRLRGWSNSSGCSAGGATVDPRWARGQIRWAQPGNTEPVGLACLGLLLLLKLMLLLLHLVLLLCRSEPHQFFSTLVSFCGGGQGKYTHSSKVPEASRRAQQHPRGREEVGIANHVRSQLAADAAPCVDTGS